jgi:hypothetical protein
MHSDITLIEIDRIQRQTAMHRAMKARLLKQVNVGKPNTLAKLVQKLANILNLGDEEVKYQAKKEPVENPNLVLNEIWFTNLEDSSPSGIFI